MSRIITYAEKPPGSNVVRAIIAALLISVVGLVAAFFAGCGTVPTKYGSVVLEVQPSRIVIGPAKGHLNEESERHSVVTYVVSGIDCTDRNAVDSPYVHMIQGLFEVSEGFSLCVTGRVGDRVLYHWERK